MLELVPFAAARNPIDVTAQFRNDPSLINQAIEITTTNGDYGSVVSFQGSIGRNPALMDATCASWNERKAVNPEVHFAVARFCTQDYTRVLETEGSPVYGEGTHATRAPSGSGGRGRTSRPPKNCQPVLSTRSPLSVWSPRLRYRWSPPA